MVVVLADNFDWEVELSAIDFDLLVRYYWEQTMLLKLDVVVAKPEQLLNLEESMKVELKIVVNLAWVALVEAHKGV